MNPTKKTRGELRCSRRVSSSCSTSGSHFVNLVTNLLKCLSIFLQCFVMADHSNNPLVVRRGCGYDEEKQMLICQGRRNDNWHVEHVAVDCCVKEMCNKDFVPTVSPITLNKPGMI